MLNSFNLSEYEPEHHWRWFWKNLLRYWATFIPFWTVIALILLVYVMVK